MFKKSTILFFLIRATVNGVALAIAAWLLPRITVVDNRLIVYIVLGAIFGLVNAFIRPIALALAGRFVIRTMGIGVIIINAIMLWLLDFFSFGAIQIDGILPALLGALIMGIVTTLLEVVLGLTRPVTADQLYEQPDWFGLDKLSRGRRNRIIENIRLQQIYGTFWRYGLDIAFGKSILGDFRAYMQRLLFPDSPQAQLSAPAKVRLMLQELGPTYVKVGQMVSSRSEALPEEWQDELDKLQSNVPPFPSDVAESLIEAELGAPVGELFATFESEPLAAASTAQVHRATLDDGTEVVVKVQRPEIETKVRADLGIMHEVTTVLEKRSEWAANYNLTGILDEFAVNVMDELDYRNEAYNARRLADNMASFPAIHVPVIYGSHSTSRVLTMEFVKGVKITDVSAIDAAGLDRAVLAEEFITAAVKQLLFDGFFHADPHPGNVLVSLESGEIIFLDLGMMGYLTNQQRMSLADMIWSLKEKDSQELAHVLIQLSQQFKPVDEAAFRRDLDRLVGRYMIYSDGGEGFSQMISAALGLMYEHGLRLDSELTLAIKSLTQCEEAARTLNPEMSMVDTSFRESRTLLMDQFNFDNVESMVRREVTRSAKELVRRVPTLHEATLKWLDQYESGKFEVTLNTDSLGHSVTRFTWSVKQLSIAIVLVGMIIGTAIVADLDFIAEWPWMPQLIYGLFLFSIGLSSVWVLVLIRDYWRGDDDT